MKSKTINSYRDLIVWQKAFELSLGIYKITRMLPSSERYGLVNQMRRASLSIPSNIAEGYCRRYLGEYIQFLGIAFASGAELETQLLLCKELYLLKGNQLQSTFDLLTEIMKMLNVLIKKLKFSKYNSLT